MTSVGYVALGIVVGGAIAYMAGAIRQYRGKDKWIGKLVDKFE